jgi:hypothetical protein
VLALSFARSTAPMAFALRYSVLPLIDAMVQLAFDNGVEEFSNPFHTGVGDFLSDEQEFDLLRSVISLQLFTRTKYFETELRRHSKPKACTRKTLDS